MERISTRIKSVLGNEVKMKLIKASKGLLHDKRYRFRVSQAEKESKDGGWFRKVDSTAPWQSYCDSLPDFLIERGMLALGWRDHKEIK